MRDLHLKMSRLTDFLDAGTRFARPGLTNEAIVIISELPRTNFTRVGKAKPNFKFFQDSAEERARGKKNNTANFFLTVLVKINFSVYYAHFGHAAFSLS